MEKGVAVRQQECIKDMRVPKVKFKHGADMAKSEEISNLSHSTRPEPALPKLMGCLAEVSSPVDASFFIIAFPLVALGSLCCWLISPEAISICQ